MRGNCLRGDSTERAALAYEEHQRASGQITARCALITLSDTRTEATDTSGARIKSLLAEHSHSVAAYRVIHDEPAELDALLDELLSRDDVDVIFTNGGTGISRRDQTIVVIRRHTNVDLPGF